jgi:hypothetical protein
MALNELFQQVVSAITNHSSQQQTTGAPADTSGLLSHIEGLFGQHAASTGQTFRGGNVKPASEDPYGDPADQGGSMPSNVQSASQDPYGDPANRR